jgi:hypothetical protein
MRGKGAKYRRRLAAALALCGVLTYSALIPGHLVSQLVNELIGSPVAAAAAAEPPCHETGEKAPSEPKAANKHCPFCTGYAAFQLMGSSAPASFPLPGMVAGDVLVETDQSLPFRHGLSAYSRGPPSLSV